jgi:hypothetical protein
MRQGSTKFHASNHSFHANIFLVTIEILQMYCTYYSNTRVLQSITQSK